MPHAFGRPLRIALYSHDTMGLGHARRNGLIASALAGAPLGAEVLLITGTREAGTFPLPRGVDCVTLPAYRKDHNGGYSARSLIRETESLTRLRARLIEVALAQFGPDVFIVDNVPRGALNELDPVLHELRRAGRTRTVLGLRDVLDDPEAVRRQWAALSNEAVIERCLDAVWVYGDQRVNDVGEAYGLAAATRARLRHIGYLDQAWRLAAAPAVSTPPGAVLCCVGGGQDGALLARTFLEVELPPGRTGLVLTGPFMPAEARLELERRAAERPGFAVLPFVAEPIGHIARAERVITMGGYNTVNELLSLGRPGLIVPRVQPRREQLIRAERLAALGLVDWLHPDRLDARALTTWLHQPPTATADPRQLLDFGALARLPGLVAELVGRHPVDGAANRRPHLATCLEGARHGIDPRAA
jgi:predicted glycosyltransferase